MRCNSCQNPLPPETATCPTCGAPTPYNRTPPALNEASTEAMPFNYGPFGGGSSAPPDAWQQGRPQPPSYNEATQSNLYGVSQSSSYYAQQPYQNQPAYRPPTVPPPTSRRRGLSGTTVVLTSLALLLLLSGLGLVFYSTVVHPGQLKAEATATTQSILATQTQITVRANAQATGTAQANVNATTTAVAVATTQAVATATVLQNAYNQATSGAPALADPLTGPDGNSWDSGLFTDGSACRFSGGAYHTSSHTQHAYVPCVGNATNFRNFAFQVQMKVIAGDSGGLYFRANNANAQGYLLFVNRNGTYNLLVSRNRTDNTELAGDLVPSIKTGIGQTNLVTVIARGATISIYINKLFAGTLHDTSFQAGQIGFLAVDITHTTEVAFSHVQVWAL